MKLFFVAILFGRLTSLAADFETSTVRIRYSGIENAHRGGNEFSATVLNKTDSLLMLVLDIRADPGLWLRKSQRQFVYLLFPKSERTVDAVYDFAHMSEEASLRVRFYFPDVTGGVTRLPEPFFDQRYDVGAGNKDIDYSLAQFRKLESQHFLIYCLPGSLAANDAGRIAEERDHGFQKIADLLGVQRAPKIRLFLFPDEESKRRETGHQGVGWAFGNNIVEVYNERTKLDSYHETAHILVGQLGSPAAALNEGFAVHASELLGGDALRELGSPGMTCDQAVIKRRASGDFISLGQLLSFGSIGPESTKPSTSYPEACSLVRFLISRFGWSRFREALGRVSTGNMSTFEELYGASAKEIELGWIASLGTP
jgi:hypothetical protein